MALTFKQPDLLKHVTYKDKFAPPKSWDQFIQDPLGWLQLWGKFQGLLPFTDDHPVCNKINQLSIPYVFRI